MASPRSQPGAAVHAVILFHVTALVVLTLSATTAWANNGKNPGVADRAQSAMAAMRAAGIPTPRGSRISAEPSAPAQLSRPAAAPSKLSGRLQRGLNIAASRRAAQQAAALQRDAVTVSRPRITPHTPMKSRQDGTVQVYVHVSRIDEDTLTALETAGLRIDTSNETLNIVQGWIDAAGTDALSTLDVVTSVDVPGYATQRVGSRLTEGDAILRADLLRALNVTGEGVKIGIISDGANDWTDARDSGDLPLSGISIYGSCDKRPEDETVCDPGADCNEGTAMAEIIHDIAPGAQIAVGGASTSLEFIDRIDDLVNDFGADIIVDDLGFRTEPFLEDGPVATAVQAATANVLFVSAAGNSAANHHEGMFIDQDPSPSIALHDFGTTAGFGSDWAYPVYAEQYGLGYVFLQWSDAFGNSANDYDLFVDIYDTTTSPFTYIDTLISENVQNGSQDPAEDTGFCNPFNFPVFGLFYVIEENASSSQFLEIQSATNPNSVVTDYAMAEGSIFGHPAVPDAVAVGAVRADDPGHDDIEFFSVHGPGRIFNPAVESRDKPDVVAIDGVSVTGTGGFVETFFGTSAAAPHVAAIAALLKEAMPHATPMELRTALLDGAIDRGDPGRDLIFGEGLIDALLSEALLDTDDDGQLNGVDDDDDGDSSSDAAEALAGTFRIDPDSDDDTVLDGIDTAPLNMNLCGDTDTDLCDDCLTGVADPGNDGRDTNNDGICDISDIDDDSDGVLDAADNCPWVHNDMQEDIDNNGVGDACQQCALLRQRGVRYQHLCF